MQATCKVLGCMVGGLSVDRCGRSDVDDTTAVEAVKSLRGELACLAAVKGQSTKTPRETRRESCRREDDIEIIEIIRSPFDGRMDR